MTDLSKTQKAQIKKLYFNNKKTIADLARMYRVSSAVIMEALRGNEQPR